jgi:acetyltransferase-like isoleucine patch superfamily enzyme
MSTPAKFCNSLWNRICRRIGGKKTDRSNPDFVFTAQNPAYVKYQIGVGTYGNPIIMDWGSQLTIGKYCCLADGVTFLLGGNHRPDWITTYPFNILWKEFLAIQGHPATKGDTVVGNDVWIGTKSLILSGVRIGDGAVIGAGSIVTKDISCYSIVAGNPAKLIRERFTSEQRNALIKIAWWNWPESKIRQAVPMLLSGKTDEFIKVYGKAG